MNYCIIQNENDKSANIWVGSTNENGRWITVPSEDYDSIYGLIETLEKVDNPEQFMDILAREWSLKLN